MPKARFTSLDLRCVVRDIQSKLVGLRVANVYDLSTKTYLLKLAKPNSKVFLVIESGVRIHSTGFSREHKDVPSVFSLKLRKAIRAKRLEKIVQYGFDRVIDLTFGSGETEHHVICEFYAGGNIVLTDSAYKILALLRTYKSEDGSMNVAIGETYPTNPQQTLQLPLNSSLNEAVATANPNTTIRDIMAKQFVIGTEMIDHCLTSCGIDGRLKAPQYSTEWTDRLIEAFRTTLSFAESPVSHKGYVVFSTAQDRAEAEKSKPAQNKKKQNKKEGAKKGGATVTPAAADSSSATSVANNLTNKTPSTTESTSAASTSTSQLGHKSTEIVSVASIADRTDVFYDNFIPFQFSQYSSLRLIEFPDFDAAVDEYFSKIESQKIEAQRFEQEGSFEKRLEKVKEDNQKRVQTLVDAEERSRRIATLIEQNAALVDHVIQIINGYLARQIDWTALADLIKQEKKKGDPIAGVIHKLKLETNSVVVLLYTPDDEEDEDDDNNSEAVDSQSEDSEDEYGDGGANQPKERKQKPDARQVKEATAVEIDLSISANKNATKYFVQTKKASEKKQKTLDAANVALKRAERKVRSDLKEVKLKASIQKLRSPYWFEKFNWFITSEGFIVVSGRDAQQNEILYKRYLAKGDAYIHADVHGASTCIVKNPTGAPIPPRTLTEAGALSVCHSAAWKNKVLTSAWWVEENQVSKTAPTGEYLSTGSFMIRGKKNFLPPSGLVMGFGILFRLADESIAAHVKETSEEDVRKEKERKHQERDLKDQLKYGEDLEAASSATTATTTPSSSANNAPVPVAEEHMVDLGGDDESDGEDDFAPPVPTGDGATNDSLAAEEETHEDEEDDDNGENEESSDDDTTNEAESGNPDAAESKFAIDLTRQENLDEDEAALLAAEESSSAASNPISSSTSESLAEKAKSGKKLTKHERMRLKKAEALGVSVTEVGKGPKPVKKPVVQETHQTAKKKKIPKKYRHQDEEERKAAMEILGSVGKPKVPTKATGSGDTAEGKGNNKGGKNATSTASGSSGSDIAQKAEARRKAQAAQLAKDKEEEEIRLLMKEEKLEQLSEADLEKLRETSAKGLGVNLGALTGRPRANDVLLYAMAVCAPYDALSDYKYKIKITPGNFKKGKSAKLAINAFLHQAESTERERELIRSIPDTELAMTMISNAKLQMAGLSSVVKKK